MVLIGLLDKNIKYINVSLEQVLNLLTHITQKIYQISSFNIYIVNNLFSLKI